ncbi:MAG: RNA chaperone Hfq [Acidobacteria bacterium]|nr:RNA chaperone Hfq [Acidobacteriota bacterium]
MSELKNAPHTADKPENIQDLFLNNARRDRALVTLVLMGGVKLTGKIRSFDKFSLILDANHQDHLVFKHAIASITTQSRPGGGNSSPAGATPPANPPAEG